MNFPKLLRVYILPWDSASPGLEEATAIFAVKEIVQVEHQLKAVFSEGSKVKVYNTFYNSLNQPELKFQFIYLIKVINMSIIFYSSVWEKVKQTLFSAHPLTAVDQTSNTIGKTTFVESTITSKFRNGQYTNSQNTWIKSFRLLVQIQKKSEHS